MYLYFSLQIYIKEVTDNKNRFPAKIIMLLLQTNFHENAK